MIDPSCLLSKIGFSLLATIAAVRTSWTSLAPIIHQSSRRVMNPASKTVRRSRKGGCICTPGVRGRRLGVGRRRRRRCNCSEGASPKSPKPKYHGEQPVEGISKEGRWRKKECWTPQRRCPQSHSPTEDLRGRCTCTCSSGRQQRKKVRDRWKSGQRGEDPRGVTRAEGSRAEALREGGARR